MKLVNRPNYTIFGLSSLVLNVVCKSQIAMANAHRWRAIAHRQYMQNVQSF